MYIYGDLSSVCVFVVCTGVFKPGVLVYVFLLFSIYTFCFFIVGCKGVKGCLGKGRERGSELSLLWKDGEKGKDRNGKGRGMGRNEMLEKGR